MARIKTQYEFIAGIYFSGNIHFVNYNLEIDFFTLPMPVSDQNLALERMSYFISSIVQDSIFISENETKQIKLLADAGMHVLTLADPGPVDPIILATIVTKLNEIVETRLAITDASISSSIGTPMKYLWEETVEDETHNVVDETDATKWWAVSIPRFASYPADTDVDQVECTSPFPLTWQMLDLGWPSEIDCTAPSGPGVITTVDFTGTDHEN